MKSLYDVFLTNLHEVKIEKEKLPKGVILQFTGKIGHANKITANGRFYPYEFMKREVSKLQGGITNKSVIGEGDHPTKDSPNSSVTRSGFYLAEINMNKDGEIFGLGNVIGTRVGKDLAALISAEVQVGISSRARGTSTTKRMTNKHPNFGINVDWENKDFESVNEDLDLITFDAVIGQAVEGAIVNSYIECQMEEAMKNIMTIDDLKKMLEENKKLNKELVDYVLQLDDVKKIIEKQNGENDKATKEQIQELLNKYLESDEFKDRFVVKVGDDGDKSSVVECINCKKEISEGVQFCQYCGVKVFKEQQISKDEKEVKFKDLEDRLNVQKEENEKLVVWKRKIEEREKLREDKEIVDKIIGECLKGKNPLIVETVQEDIKKLALTPDNVKDVIETKLKLIESLVKKTSMPKGIGFSIPGDAGNDSKKKDESIQILDNLSQ